MRDWFNSLEQRERLFVMVGAVAVVVALFYTLVWAPIDREYRSMQARC